LEDDERARAGVLGMPGRCSHEKGTEEERSGEGRNRWNGGGGKKGNGEAGGAKDGEWPFGLDDGKRRRRRRRVDTAEEGDGEAGIEAILQVGWWWWWWRRVGACTAQQRTGAGRFCGARAGSSQGRIIFCKYFSNQWHNLSAALFYRT
jgi:hypothetical protein